MQAANCDLTKSSGRWDRWPHLTVARGSLAENGQSATEGNIEGKEENPLKFNVRKRWPQLKAQATRHVLRSMTRHVIDASRRLLPTRRVVAPRSMAMFSNMQSVQGNKR